MKIEAVDPIAPSKIRPATVTKQLGDNYILIELDHMKDNLDRSIEFCYHRTSSSIFNPGFCRANALELEKPFGNLTISLFIQFKLVFVTILKIIRKNFHGKNI